MPILDHRVVALFQTLENDVLLAEPLLVPSVASLGEKPEKVRAALSDLVRHSLGTQSALYAHCHRVAGTPSVGETTLTLEPPAKLKPWSEPLVLTFHTATWQQGDALICAIPALGIDVLARNEKELRSILEEHLRFALARKEALTSVRKLTLLQRCTELKVDANDITVTLKSPKEYAITREGDPPEKQILKELADELLADTLPEAYGIDANVAQLAELLTGNPPRSVLLVGKSGSGKTALTRELVRQRFRLQLGHVPIYATSGSRLVAGHGGYGMWQERCQKLWREAAKLKAILFLGNLLELVDAGKSVHVQQGVGGFLRPGIERGDLLTVVECTPEQHTILERRDPHLLAAFEVIQVQEPDAATRRLILHSSAEALKRKYFVSMSADALEKTDRLHQRFATYSAFPGRPLRFLKNIFHDAKRGATLSVQDVTAAFSRETGLPLFMLDPALPLDLAETRGWFNTRVIGQHEATELIVDLLAAAKAGLTRPKRPLASLLFIGPTGVGKTEMAKALAERLFGDRGRLARFDMSEYAELRALHRLIGGGGAKSEGLLTAKVREQPFSVILFDEFEKAHPNFFDLLLQVLGDARLTDEAGRLADFTNAVVIMTSNLGAQAYQQGQSGFKTGDRAEQRASALRDHFMHEAQAFFRPEFFNRIDSIVPFGALSADVIAQITRRELALLAHRHGAVQRKLTLNAPDSVIEHLARVGMDPRYGARPLKRAIERQLLVPLADAMNGYSAEWPLAADISAGANGLAVKVHIQDGRTPAVPQETLALAESWTALRRRVQHLERAETVQELRSEFQRLAMSRRREELRKKGKVLPPWPRLAELTRVLNALDALSVDVIDTEADALLPVVTDATSDRARLLERLGTTWRQCDALMMELFALSFPESQRIVLALYGDPWTKVMLACAYADVARRSGFTIAPFVLGASYKDDIDGRPEFVRAPLIASEFFQLTPDVAVHTMDEALIKSSKYPIRRYFGLALNIHGKFAHPRLAFEQGLHEFKQQAVSQRVYVHTSDVVMKDYEPPAMAMAHDFTSAAARRTYTLKDKKFSDYALKKDFAWTIDSFEDTLANAIQELLTQKLEAML